MLLSLTAKRLHVVMLKRPLNLFMAIIIQKALMLTPHYNTDTVGTATCLPVAGCAPPARGRVSWSVWKWSAGASFFRGTHLVTDLKPLAPPTERQWIRLVRLLAAGKKKLTKKSATKPTYKSKIKIPSLYCCRKVDSCLQCKFRNGAWRPRAAFRDSVVTFENAIIYIDTACTYYPTYN